MTVLTVADPAGLAAVELVALGTTGRLVTAPDVLDQATDILVRDLEDIDRVASRFRDDSDLSSPWAVMWQWPVPRLWVVGPSG